MSDVEITLHRTPGEEPLAVLRGSYRDLARMHSRDIVEQAVSDFESEIDADARHWVALSGEDERTRKQQFHPLNLDEEQVRHELGMHIRALVDGWRGGDSDD